MAHIASSMRPQAPSFCDRKIEDLIMQVRDGGLSMTDSECV